MRGSRAHGLAADLRSLAGRVRGETFRPEGDGYDGHDRYDEERTGFQRAARHRPVIIVARAAPGAYAWPWSSPPSTVCR